MNNIVIRISGGKLSNKWKINFCHRCASLILVDDSSLGETTPCIAQSFTPEIYEMFEFFHQLGESFLDRPLTKNRR